MGRHTTIAVAAITIGLLGVGLASAVTRPAEAGAQVLAVGTVAVAPVEVADERRPDRGRASPAAKVAEEPGELGSQLTARLAPNLAPHLAPHLRPNYVGPNLGAVPAVPPASLDPDELPRFSDRRLTTFASPFLPEPTSTRFVASVQAVPADVLARSTWHPGCPVALDELRYITVTHVGFDGLAHLGELMVHHSVAEPFVEIFRRLYEARYPIERMWVVDGGLEPDEDPWWHGSDNNTASFVCRPSVSSKTGRWSEHAFGLAVDINPYHNPYVKGDVVVPPHAVSYLERDDRPGIIHDGDVVVTSFAEIGWTWGGNWSSATDWMHFSWNDH